MAKSVFFQGFVSPPVNLNLASLHLDRTSQPKGPKKEAKALPAAADAHTNGFATVSDPDSTTGTCSLKVATAFHAAAPTFTGQSRF